MALPPTSAPAPSVKAAQIMAAARQLFLANGYGATSMDAVARAATVSKATLYSHFDSKADLFAAMVSVECARVVPSLAGPEVDDLPVAEALFRMGCDFLDLLLSPQSLAVYRLVVAETPRFPELGLAFHQSGPARTLAMLSDYLERAQNRRQLEIADPTVAAELLWGMIRSHFHLRALLGVDVESPTAAQRARHVRGAVELFVRGHAVT